MLRSHPRLIMSHGMDFTGLNDDDLADQVGLFSVLDMQFSWEGQADAQDDRVVCGHGGMSPVAMVSVPAPPTPPLPPILIIGFSTHFGSQRRWIIQVLGASTASG